MEIKFSVWDKKKRTWVEDDYKNLIRPVLTTEGVMILEFSAIDDSAKVLDDTTSRYEVNLYTGLKDKNRKEIYEKQIAMRVLHCVG